MRKSNSNFSLITIWTCNVYFVIVRMTKNAAIISLRKKWLNTSVCPHRRQCISEEIVLLEYLMEHFQCAHFQNNKNINWILMHISYACIASARLLIGLTMSHSKQHLLIQNHTRTTHFAYGVVIFTANYRTHKIYNAISVFMAILWLNGTAFYTVQEL